MPVIGRAIISDLASGKAAARAFSLMMVVGGGAPVVGPLAGGFLIGWRGALTTSGRSPRPCWLRYCSSYARRTPSIGVPRCARCWG